MEYPYSVTLERFIRKLEVEPVYLPDDAAGRKIVSLDVNRPGLCLAGFYNKFDEKRVQVLGRTEMAYLDQLTPEVRAQSMDRFLSEKVPAVISSRGLEPQPEMIAAARKYGVPLFKTDEPTATFMPRIIAFLSLELAPRTTKHGVLVEVYGEGVLLLGESGVGKSETAIELVKRGHRLIADDAVEIKRASHVTLVGTSPENIRHFVELRGIGIINVRQIFGMGAIKVSEKIDLIVQLEVWDQHKPYDRMGLHNEYTEILGLEVPSITLPVKPGRNLAVIIEVAAMNHRQKKLGYNAAQELLVKLGLNDDVPDDELADQIDFISF